MTYPYINLRLHSAYSLCEGAVKIQDLIHTCETNNIPAIAITDTNNMFGALEFATKAAASGVQPIIGLQIDVWSDHTIAPVVLYAKNEQGYKNLMKLMTCFFITNHAEKRYVTFDDLQQHNYGIIALTGGATGLAGNYVTKNNHEYAIRVLSNMKSIYKDNFYIEISRTNEPEEKITEPFFINYALQNNIPLVATNEVFFLDKSMHMAHDALMCIADATYMTVKDRRKISTEHYLKSTDEMFE